MTDKKTEALKLALEAAYLAGFKDSAEGYNYEYPFSDHCATPTKDRRWIDRRDAYIREALAEQKSGIKQVIELYDSPEQPAQQEPVAYGVLDEDGQIDWTCEYPFSDDPGWPGSVPLYTSPPASKPLTDEEEVE